MTETASQPLSFTQQKPPAIAVLSLQPPGGGCKLRLLLLQMEHRDSWRGMLQLFCLHNSEELGVCTHSMCSVCLHHSLYSVCCQSEVCLLQNCQKAKGMFLNFSGSFITGIQGVSNFGVLKGSRNIGGEGIL